MVQHAVDEIILQEKKKPGVEYETHENIDDEVNEYDMYKLDKLSPDEKKLHKPAFESKLKIIYDMKRLNNMNHIHDNKVNKIAECNVLHNMKILLNALKI